MNFPEQSIRIKDLIYTVLRAWRSLLLLALAGTLVLGGLAYYRNLNVKQDENAGTVVTLTADEIDKITKDVLANDPDILVYSETIAKLDKRSTNLKDRLTNSLYLSINENAQPIVTFDVVVTPEEPSVLDTDTFEQRSYQLSLEFLRQIKQGELVKYIASETNSNVSSSWLAELVDYRRNEDDSLSIEVTAPEKDMAVQLAAYAQDFFVQGIREFITVPYLYGVEHSDEELVIVKNPAILEQREGFIQEREDIKDELSIAEKAIEARLDEILEEKRLAKESGTVISKPVKHSVRKFALAGLFVGVLMAAFWAVYRAASSGVIRYPHEFADQTGLLFIGTVFVPGRESRGFGSGLDRLLERLFYGRKGSGSSSHGAEYIASILSGLDLEDEVLDTGKKRLAVILVGGEEETVSELSQALAMEPADEEDGYALDLSGVPADLDTEEGVRQLRSSDAALLVVRSGKTPVKAAVRYLEIAWGMGKKILGVIAEERQIS